jgi:hypothetical protein
LAGNDNSANGSDRLRVQRLALLYKRGNGPRNPLDRAAFVSSLSGAALSQAEFLALAKKHGIDLQRPTATIRGAASRPQAASAAGKSVVAAPAKKAPRSPVRQPFLGFGMGTRSARAPNAALAERVSASLDAFHRVAVTKGCSPASAAAEAAELEISKTATFAERVRLGLEEAIRRVAVTARKQA